MVVLKIFYGVAGPAKHKSFLWRAPTCSSAPTTPSMRPLTSSCTGRRTRCRGAWTARGWSNDIHKRTSSCPIVPEPCSSAPMLTASSTRSGGRWSASFSTRKRSPSSGDADIVFDVPNNHPCQLCFHPVVRRQVQSPYRGSGSSLGYSQQPPICALCLCWDLLLQFTNT